MTLGPFYQRCETMAAEFTLLVKIGWRISSLAKKEAATIARGGTISQVGQYPWIAI